MPFTSKQFAESSKALVLWAGFFSLPYISTLCFGKQEVADVMSEIYPTSAHDVDTLNMFGEYTATGLLVFALAKALMSIATKEKY